MKRLIFAFAILAIGLSALPAQDISLQLAVTTQSLDRQMLTRLGVPANDIDEILELQNEFRQKKESTALELNVIKARIAQQLYNADANDSEIARLLEKASELRLEQEMAQVRTHLRVRQMIGEENWGKLMQQIRTQERSRQQDQADSQSQTGGGSTSTGSSGSSSRSAGSGSSGGSANRR